VTWEEVFAIVRRQVGEVLPEVDTQKVSPDARMADLGANSLDRMDVVVTSQQALGLRISATEFADVANLRGLVDVLHKHCGA
jgi:polyketide biosynthesis acyl carrier protein